MNGVGAGQFRNPDHFLDRQVTLDRPDIAFKMRPATNLIGFVSLETVQRQLVFFRPDGNRLDAKFIGGAKDTDGDFRTVGYENFGDGQCRTPVRGEETRVGR